MSHDALQSWVGREEHQRDTIDIVRARRLHALLDRPVDELQPGTLLPPGYHWPYCVAITPRSAWGSDGHPRRGGFLPPLPATRRMWAGGSLRFLHPLSIGVDIERRSIIESIEEKIGRAGRFHLVRIAHRFSTNLGVAIDERQHLVHLPAAMPANETGGRILEQTIDWRDSFTADEVALFHFSALTMNGHRIHYDQPYTTREEAYPALLVHAPLTALLLLDAARRHGCTIGTFEYRAIAPLFCGETITLAGRSRPNGSVALWALRENDGIAMEATATRHCGTR